MSQPNVFDPRAYKSTTRAQWDAAAAAWHRWGPLLHGWLGAATDRMLDLAGVGPGSRVGPSGRVLATDLSPAILELAHSAARAAGLDHVSVRQLDGEELDVLPESSFDAVISRVGLIYFPDQQKALSGMRRVLATGGRVGAIVYSTPERNAFFSIPVKIIRRRANLPPPLPGQPGPFSLGGPGVLGAAFERAGFRDVVVEAMDCPVRLGAAADCVRFERESFGALHQMMASLSEAEREDTWREIEDELRRFEGADGFVGPCEMLIAAATR